MSGDALIGNDTEMAYRELIVELDRAQAEAYSDALIDLGALSVSVEDAEAVLGEIAMTRLIPGFVLFGSVYLLFYSLTPSRYRHRRYPKWPGALFVSVWWVLVLTALPWALRRLFHYDATYGSLAGVMITLFFFWLVGLGMVFGAELNAALAETPEERDMVGQADNRTRAAQGT